MLEFTYDSGLWETRQHVPAFDATLAVYVIQEGGEPPTQRQREIVESLNSLPEDIRQDVARHALDYFRKGHSDIRLADDEADIDAHNISRYYRIKSVLVPEISDCDTDYFFISADCDWEEEHGMQVFSVGDGHVLSCGDHSTLPFSPQWHKLVSSPKAARAEMLKEFLA